MSGKWENSNIPHSGWECIDIQDLGKPVMTCQMCDRETIRYVHYMRHQKYKDILEVGCICAGKMEGSSQKARERDSFFKSRINKRKNWLNKKWKTSKKGNQYIESDDYIIVMKQADELWNAFIRTKNDGFNKWCAKKSKNINEIKLDAFDCLTKILIEKKISKPVSKNIFLPEKTTETNIIQTKVPEKEIIEKPVFKKPYNEIIQNDLFDTSDSKTVTIFTNEQKKIFKFIKDGIGHGIIDAVAGAGKTTTIMECSRYVPDKSSVLFCAFNKSIQTEIANKFNKQGLNQVTVKTIHALGFKMLNDNNRSNKKIIPQESKYWSILNKDEDLNEKFKEYFEELLELDGYTLDETESNKQFAVKDITNKFKEKLLDMNQKIRATLTPNDIDKFNDLIKHFNYFTETELKNLNINKEIQIYFECSKILLDVGNTLAQEALIIDYTDMLYLPYIWNLSASKTYSYLFIDECQDLSKSQLAVVLKYGQKDIRILAVGDPYQSIYGFAGADIESFNRIKKTLKANPLPLTTCFRCPSRVVSLAASIRNDIKANKKEHGIIEEISFKQVVKKARENDLIISRYREPILFLVFEFINIGKQVQIHRDEVDDIIDELKKLFKQEERTAVISEISYGFETLKETVYNRWRFIIDKEARKIANSNERTIYIQMKNEYLENKLEFLHKKYLLWKDICPTINDILHKIKDYMTAAENCIKLSTIHRAKGLEAQRVFILNFNELPHFNPNQKPWETIQENNLKYVAITRSLNELYLVKSEKKDNLKKDASLFDELYMEI